MPLADHKHPGNQPAKILWADWQAKTTPKLSFTGPCSLSLLLHNKALSRLRGPVLRSPTTRDETSAEVNPWGKLREEPPPPHRRTNRAPVRRNERVTNVDEIENFVWVLRKLALPLAYHANDPLCAVGVRTPAWNDSNAASTRSPMSERATLPVRRRSVSPTATGRNALEGFRKQMRATHSRGWRAGRVPKASECDHVREPSN